MAICRRAWYVRHLEDEFRKEDRMSVSETEWTEILELAITLAKAAGAELRHRFGQQRTVTLKSDLDPVTDADYAVERLIREGIMAAYPSHTILGEEGGLYERHSSIRWI